jgi:hypothetical protein
MDKQARHLHNAPAHRNERNDSGKLASRLVKPVTFVSSDELWKCVDGWVAVCRADRTTADIPCAVECFIRLTDTILSCFRGTIVTSEIFISPGF